MAATAAFDPDEVARIAEGMHPWQWQVYRHPARFRLVVCGRRSGKSFLLCRELIRAAQVKENSNVAYLAPNLKQAKRILWRDLKNTIAPEFIAHKNETELEIILKHFNSSIRLYGDDNSEALRGIGLDFIAIDECADVKADTYFSIIRPALSDRLGHCICAGTPKGVSSWIYDVYVKAEAGTMPDWAVFSVTTEQSGNIDRAEIEEARRQLSPRVYKQEYQAEFLQSINRVIETFVRAEHVDRRVRDPGPPEPVHIFVDMNVNPYSVILAVQRPVHLDGEGEDEARDAAQKGVLELHLDVFGEIPLWGGHTQMAIQEIKDRLGLHGSPEEWPRRAIVYPDPSGRQRRTSAGGVTDISLFSEAGFEVIAPARAPAVRDRMNCLQRLFMNERGESKIRIHPSCLELIRSLEGLCYSADGRPDKAHGLDHMVDALGYGAWSLYPLITYQVGTARLYGT